MLPEHGQLMQYDVQDTSTSSCTHGSATGMVRWQPLCRICTRIHATRAERAAEATSARVASTGTAESGTWQRLLQDQPDWPVPADATRAEVASAALSARVA